jgi:glycosyltransferase involved in cell wall biosynthesis
MATLSLAMIVRDEEATLGRVLADVAGICDEMVVVDTGSTDRTREIAVAAGAKVVEFEWIDDFAAARNASFDACTSDWVLWLDADDRVPQLVQDGIREAKESLLTDDMDAVWMPYRYHIDPATGQSTFTLRRERIVRRAAGFRWAGAVHEVLDVSAGRTVARDDLYVEHHRHESKAEAREGRNLRILQNAVRSGDRSPRTLFYYGNELRDAKRYDEALNVYSQYLVQQNILWERHSAVLSMAQCADALGDTDRAELHLFQAMHVDPSRNEPFLALGLRRFNKQEWAAALPYYAAAASAKLPVDGFVTPADYTWRPWDHLGVCLINLGRYDEGIDATVRSLKLGNPDVDRLTANIHWALKQAR